MEQSDTRERILAAAWKIAARDGLAQVTLARVAGAAGISRQGLYLHFGNRATLLLEMARAQDVRSGFAAKVQAVWSAAPREAFERLLRAWIEYLPSILPVARALDAAATTGDEGHEAFRDRMDEWWRVLRRAVRRLEDAGLLAEAWSGDGATDWVWSATHPSAYHLLQVERGWSHERTRTQLLAVGVSIVGPARRRTRNVANPDRA